MSAYDALVVAMRGALAERRTSVRAVALGAGLPVRSVQSVLDGRIPSINRAAEICDALGLEFYIGPRRLPGKADASDPARRPPWVDELKSVVETEARGLRGGIRDDMEVLLDQGSPSHEGEVGDPLQGPVISLADHLPVPFAQHVRAAAGSGEMVFDETVELCLAFRRTLLPSWARLDMLVCIQAAGDSMEPTLHDEDLTLLDRSSIDPIDKEIFVIYTDSGLMVKRLRRQDGRWELSSDNPDYAARPAETDDRIVGRVAWHGPLAAVSPVPSLD